jgi:hypothetical protein
LTGCIPLLERQNDAARAEGDCDLADTLLRDILLIEAKERLCTSVDQWDRGHFGNAWEALARADIDISVVAANGGGPAVSSWSRLVADCQRRFPRIVGASIEGEVRSACCSICGRDVLSCSHMPGRIYCGVLCSKVVKDVDLRGTSLVRDAAQPEARVLKVGAIEVAAEGLFWDQGECR